MRPAEVAGCPRPGRFGAGHDCLTALADGWIQPQDLCPACTRLFMAGLDWAAGRKLGWHRNYMTRAGNPAQTGGSQ